MLYNKILGSLSGYIPTPDVLLYVSGRSGNVICCVDATAPSNMRVLNTYVNSGVYVPASRSNIYGVRDLQQYGSVLYASSFPSGGTGHLHAIDISKPVNPYFKYTTYYAHQYVTRADVVNDNTLIVTYATETGTSGTTLIYDVSSGSPQDVWSYTHTNLRNHCIIGDFLYMLSDTGTNSRIYNISNLSNITLANEYSFTGVVRRGSYINGTKIIIGTSSGNDYYSYETSGTAFPVSEGMVSNRGGSYSLLAHNGNVYSNVGVTLYSTTSTGLALGSLTLPETTSGTACWSASGDYLYIAGTVSGILYAVNISNPSSMTISGSINLSSYGINTYVSGVVVYDPNR